MCTEKDQRLDTSVRVKGGEKKLNARFTYKGSNPRPAACKADVITTTPTNQLACERCMNNSLKRKWADQANVHPQLNFLTPITMHLLYYASQSFKGCRSYDTHTIHNAQRTVYHSSTATQELLHTQSCISIAKTKRQRER